MKQNPERGALIVEATFVFPIMFLVIFLMLVAGNGYFQKCRVDALITRYAIDGAAYCADPQLKSIDKGELPTLANVEVYPYRAFSGSDASEIKASVSIIEDALNKSIQGLGTGLFSAMKPSNMSLSTDYSNLVLTSSYSIQCSYDIGLPVRLLFSDEWLKIGVNTRVEMPVSNVTELIRNADMAEDYMEQYGIDKPIKEGIGKITEAIGKVKSWFG